MFSKPNSLKFTCNQQKQTKNVLQSVKWPSSTNVQQLRTRNEQKHKKRMLKSADKLV